MYEDKFEYTNEYLNPNNFDNDEPVEKVKPTDKYFETVFLKNNHGKRIKVGLFGSGEVGTKIRNAVTGFSYNFNVGNMMEDTLFKVYDSTARRGRREPLVLYYDSPEQFEQHQFTVVPVDTKLKWQTRYYKMRND
jgi:hypothetical protein